MKCPRCQHENEAGAKFCEECATPLARACSKCGRPLSPTAKFCPECAHPTGLSAALPAAQRFDSPESYTPRHLAEKILTSKSALEGERKQVTVLFADLKGSMELLADRDPEEARKILDPVLEHMMEAVHRYEGTVNQVMGDGIMALFGAPLAHEDHAVRACYAALRMQETVKRYAEGVRREHGITIRIRVGLNSGEVVVRAIGSDLHMDYTAVGQTTHLAARLEQLADPGSILLTPDTLALAEGFVQVTPLGPMAVRGLSAPVEVYELTGISAVRSRLHATAGRGLSRFVGRDAEMEQLRRALDQARQGRGQVVALVGEPGVGKSRLVFELTHSHRVEGWLGLEAGSVSYGKATSYLPVIDLLRGYFRIGPRDPYRDVREKVTGRVLTLDRSLEPTLPAVLALLDVPVEDPEWQALDPPQRRQRTLDSVKRLLMREAQSQPLLVVFEDLHWIDSETQALLDSLVESLPTAPVLLLVSYRPGYGHGWGQKMYYSQLRLDPLPPESAEVLLDALLGSDRALRPLKHLLIERTEGNPFFLEESVRTLVETKVLAGERAAYRLLRPIQSIDVPPTVQVILAARIDRLSADDKRLLQTASVIGKDPPSVLLQAVAELAEDAVQRGLAHLQAAEFLYETRLFPDPEYTFKHALTHEVAYGSVLQERRRALHGRIVEAIETLYPDRLPEQVDRLAHHAFRGELWEKAVRYLRQAGTRAARHSANRAAVAWLEQALTALDRVAETRETQERSIDIRIELHLCHWLSGELRRLYPSLREAERLARTLGDQRRLGWVSGSMSHCLGVTGELTQAHTYARDTHEIGAALGDVMLTAAAEYYLGWISHTRGDLRRAEGFFRKAIQSSRGGVSPGDPHRDAIRLAVSALWCLAVSLGERGRFQEGIALAQEGFELAEASDNAHARVMAEWGLGLVYSLAGDFPRAAALLDRALDLSRRSDFATQSARIAGQLGYTYALSERIGEGLSLIRQALVDLEAMGMVESHSLVVTHLGDACRLAGQLEEAHAAATRALSLARERGERGREADALRLLGDVAARCEPIADATTERHYSQALAIATELGMRPLTAHCHLGLGKLYRRTGDHTKAEEQLTAAATMYGEMGMTFWLEKAETALGPPPRNSP
jgi:class 3 adenylate cyclase/tetratricopeptide (TPR) repeat protein